MKTIRIRIYKFNELTESAKSTVIERERENLDFDYIYSDAYNTVKEFNRIFNVKEGNQSWLNFSLSHIDDDILNLSGLRLHKYLINNFFSTLFRPAYLKHGETSETLLAWHPMRKQKEITTGPNKGKFIVSYYSNWKREISYNLTGVCYDYDILKPIYDFLSRPDSTNFEQLINECFQSLENSIENEKDFLQSDENLIEQINEADRDYTKDGNEFFN